MGHILTEESVTKSGLKSLFKQAKDFKNNWPAKWTPLQGHVMATLFFEPSTRTRLSFESAMKRMGGTVISCSDGQSSSCAKGESIADTIKTVSYYADLMVIRSKEPHTEWKCDDHYVPIINAGDGPWNHPTQALIDAYTIWEQFGRLDALKIGITGDSEKSRTIASLVKLLSQFTGNRFFVYDCTGRMLEIPTWVKEGMDVTMMLSEHALMMQMDEIDVLYQNRIQKERRDQGFTAKYHPLILNGTFLASMKREAIIMNPGPRQEEFPTDYDGDPRNFMWKQVENGLYIRMALLYALLLNN